MTRGWPAILMALLVPLAASAGPPGSRNLRVPLVDLGPGTYKGFQGGLFPGGANDMPADHRTGGMLASAAIVPRDAAGNPAPNGRYVLVSIGMSNTTQEFCGGTSCTPGTFMADALADPAVNHTTLAIVDGAAGGQTADLWDSPSDANYDRVRDTRLAPRGLTEAQVQIAWVKVANSGPTVALPQAASDAYRLVTETGNILRALKVRYPNVKQVYLSTRIYGGYATTTLNPEPYAYESGFAAKWVVEAQIQQMRTGQVDPRAGDLDYAIGPAPWVTWGAYLWADGLNPRSDGLRWEQGDFVADGTHPSAIGREKVAKQLLVFFKRDDSSRCWFLAGSTCP